MRKFNRKVLKMMGEMEKIRFECVCVSENHAHQVMEWRNDPVTRAMSFHQELKEWDPFWKEFQERFFVCPALPPLFILVDGNRAGFLAFHPISHPLGKTLSCCEISIQIAPEYRGKGVGVQALKALHPWVLQQGFQAIYAEVKDENVASQKMFVKAGYQEIGHTDKHLEDSGQKSPIIRYLVELSKSEASSKVFVIAEAGSNWRVGSPAKDLEMGKALIAAAAEAGADAVKFQTYRAQNLYVKNAGQIGYLESSGFHEDVYSLLENLEMPYEMLEELAKTCQKWGVEFMSTPFSKQDFLFIDPFVKRHKIASYELNHPRLLELAAQSGKPLFLSTGASTEAEIAWAVKTFKAYGGKELTLLQCTAAYPAPPDSLNLRAIAWMKARFRVSVGLSDHSLHPLYAPLAAVALGATAIEKHFTLDRHLPGPDHAYALLPEELKEMIKTIREGEKMLGTGFKTENAVESELRLFARRGLQAIAPIKKGGIFEEGKNIDILRPGNQKPGIHPKFIFRVEGKKATRSLSEGEGIQYGDWE
jgi:N-acetylneuraminate synthase